MFLLPHKNVIISECMFLEVWKISFGLKICSHQKARMLSS